MISYDICLSLPDPPPFLMEIQIRMRRLQGSWSNHRFLSASQTGWPMPLPCSSGVARKMSLPGGPARFRLPQGCQGSVDAPRSEKESEGKVLQQCAQHWLRQSSGARMPAFSFLLGVIMVCDLGPATQAFWASVWSHVMRTAIVSVSQSRYKD